MSARVNHPMIPEAELLRQAGDWLMAHEFDARRLQELSQQRGLDFATAVLYQALRQSPRHGPLIDRLEEPTPHAPHANVKILIAPGAFYQENPETGAAGRLIRESARRLGCAVTLAPLRSFGTLTENADLLADCLRQHQDESVVLVSHSKASTEIRRLLARPEARELFRPVKGWLDISGLFLGTPIIDWLRRHPVNRSLVRLLFWWKGHAFTALDEIDRAACPPWPDALHGLPEVNAIHVVGFPLERHLSTPLIRRGYRRLAHLGPNDGTILLEDVLSLPGRVYPVWGADHYLQPSHRDVCDLIGNILRTYENAVSVPDQVTHAKELV